MAHSGLYIMFLVTSSGHPYQNVYAPVLVLALLNVAVPPAVKQNVYTVMCGDAQGPIVHDGAGNISAMTNTTAANVPAVSPLHIVICKDNEQKYNIIINHVWMYIVTSDYMMHTGIT